MAIAGGLSAAGASLYYLSGNTEFFWSTYQSLPAIGFNGIPVAMLASCNRYHLHGAVHVDARYLGPAADEPDGL